MLVGLTATSHATATASVAQATGRAVFEREYAASHGYVDYAVNLTMDLRSKTGKTTQRSLSIKQLESANASTMTLITIDQPKSIRGTGLLTHSHPLVDDDQWLFIPGLNRTKRIAARDRRGAFVGSAFSYEDLADYTVDEFEYDWQRTETCGALTCDVVKRTPVDPYSGYAFQLVWVDQTDHRIRQLHLYDTNGILMKTLTVEDYRPYQVHDRTLLFPHKMHMENVQTGRGTTLIWTTYQFNQGFSASRDFSTNALRRVR
jgi:outer membrane lipoprotein-sorting protein